MLKIARQRKGCMLAQIGIAGETNVKIQLAQFSGIWLDQSSKRSDPQGSAPNRHSSRHHLPAFSQRGFIQGALALPNVSCADACGVCTGLWISSLTLPAERGVCTGLWISSLTLPAERGVCTGLWISSLTLYQLSHPFLGLCQPIDLLSRSLKWAYRASIIYQLWCLNVIT